MDLAHPMVSLIVAACLNSGLLRNQAAYCLATAQHETGNFKYLREIWGPTAAQKRYEDRTDLGNTQKGDGKRFMGRGLVHITGRRNYTDWSKRLGLDLLKSPELAEKPEIAVRILVEGMKLGTFTGKKLSDYMTLRKSDFRQARRIVNGMDRADLIADYAKEFDALLLAAGYGVEKKPVGASKPVPAPQQPAKPQSPSTGTTGGIPGMPDALPIEPGTVHKLPPDNSKLPARNVWLAWLIDAFMAVFWPKRKEK